MRDRNLAREQGFIGGLAGPGEDAGPARTGGGLRWEKIQEELAGRIARLEGLLADAAAAAASLRELLEPVGSLSRFMRELETSLGEVREAFDHTQAPAARAQIASIRAGVPHVVAVPVEEPSAEEEATSPEPGPWAVSAEEAPSGEEELSSEPATPSEPRPARPISLQFESSDGYLDLMTVDRVLREDPRIVDLDLAEYGGRRATIKVWLTSDGEPSDEMVGESVRRILGSLQRYAPGVSVEIADEREED